jgi:hypothetical protein
VDNLLPQQVQAAFFSGGRQISSPAAGRFLLRRPTAFFSGCLNV